MRLPVPWKVKMPFSMKVIKRDGRSEPVSFDKVLERVRKAAKGLSVNPDALAQQVLSQIYDGVKTSELDELTAQLAASLSTLHPDWGTLAARICVSNHHKNTRSSFVEVVKCLANQTMPATGEKASLVSEDLIRIVETHGYKIDSYIQYDRDYNFDYFGFKTLEKSYLLRDTQMRVVERPQHMWMRVALGLWWSITEEEKQADSSTAEKLGLHVEGRLAKAFETYDLMSQKFLTHATPTLFNAGLPRQQLSSCFLLAMSDDSISGIYKTLSDCAAISKYSGGIGLHIHNVRARGSLIKGTNGQSNGIVPMLRVFNNTARYVDQGGGRRNGSFAIYLEPWHADVEDFLKMKLPTGAEEERARDLFYALWIPDLFMERVEADGDWTLFCPNEAPGLADVWGDAFKELYERYEREGRGRRQVKAQKLWFQILDAQMESGTPYLLYKDAANRKSNQQNLGTIKSSNLCTEIIEYSDANETAVCNLASLALPSFVSTTHLGGYDFEALRKATHVAIRNLNRVIDINFYPTPETKQSNMRHRPVGLGVQGLADVFAMLGLLWESEEASKLNQRIFEHIYYAAVEMSAALATQEGSYSTFAGSPASQGKLQPDLWSVTPLTETDGSLDWTALRQKASKGLRNSLLIAPMPTASTSQILGFNECFEPFTNNIYTRRTLAGEFIVINKYLVKDLMKRGLWSEDMKQQIVARNGSVQGLTSIPDDLQALYKTSWEIKQRCLVDMAAARGAFICQSQSLNLFVADPNYGKLSSMHMYSWKQGLKTGCYYLRTKAPVTAQKFTVDPRLLAAAQKTAEESKLNNITETEEDEDVWSSDSDDEDRQTEKTLTSEQKKAAERRAMLDRLATEYEAEVARVKAAKERGEEVCEMCSS
jgi:ribonucleoside-diphosphate reductase alpha subunit